MTDIENFTELQAHSMEQLLDPNGFLTFYGYQSSIAKVQLRELCWNRGAL